MTSSPSNPSVTETPIGNPAQWEAIRRFQGPCEVLAGPGSGKTFVLVRHILYLIEHYRVEPAHILVLTFSKAAALEMQSRFLKLCNGRYRDVVFGTFHSVFYRIYQSSTDLRPILIEPSLKQRLLQNYLREYLPEHIDDSDLRALEDFLAKVKTTALPGETSLIQTLLLEETHFQNPKALQKILHAYHAYLTENHLIDFEDMIGSCLELFRKDAGTLEYWQKRFTYCLVDEFQDLNDMQWKVLRLLMDRNGSANLFVVGDDDQSIYGFRGSKPSILRDFTDTYETAVRIPLQVNYRSSSDIVHISKKIIETNRDRIPKTVTANRRTKGPRHDVEIRAYRTREQEYEELCKELEAMALETQKNCAVIFRTHSQAQFFLHLLQHRGLSYQTVSVEKNPMFAEILNDLSAYYHLAQQLSEGRLYRKDFYRVMNRPSRLLLRETMQEESVRIDAFHQAHPTGTPTGDTIENFLQDLTALYRLHPRLSLKFLRSSIGYENYLQTTYPKPEQLEKIQELWKTLEEEASRCMYCSELAQILDRKLHEEAARLNRISSDQKKQEAKEKEAAKEKTGVHVITMHACKGLEYENVYLPDLNEGVVPNRRAVTVEEVEEERRLFYVAMTRARNHLVMMFLKGEKENPRRPSRFLEPLGNFEPYH